MSQHPGPGRGSEQTDLASREEVAEFVTRFYREIAQDQRFHHYFETIANVNWKAHTSLLTDFWTDLLFPEISTEATHASEHMPGKELIEAHRWLHEASSFDDALFDQWLDIFDTTLDEGWSGPRTEQVRSRGRGIAWAMRRRFAAGELGRMIPAE